METIIFILQSYLFFKLPIWLPKCPSSKSDLSDDENNTHVKYMAMWLEKLIHDSRAVGFSSS